MELVSQVKGLSQHLKLRVLSYNEARSEVLDLAKSPFVKSI